MSNQLIITSGAKVRNLSGVLTATSGVVDSVGLGTANGVATLDSNGKVPLSQLPASVVTYLGTWNAATNTPTLANGTGDIGDLYICNVAGTVNFGAGPITFAVGDWVIYNGSQWQKSAGASGTVTSVAMTVPTGLSVTGSPITTSGTLAVSLASGYTIPTTSFLSGLVPYTGATTQVDLGSNNLYGRNLNVWGDGTNGGGLNLKQYTSQSFLAGYGYTAVYSDTSYNLNIWFLNGASTSRQINFNASLLANNSGQTYYLPAATGTIALTSDIPSLTNYVTTNTNQTISGIKTFSNEQLFGNGITLTGGYITYTSGAYNLTLNTSVLTANRNVFLQDKAGTIALTSDLTGGTVTSVGLSSATSGVTISSSPITTSGTITLAIATASGSQQGLLSSTDWTTFNNKQNALTNPITGTGTTNTHAKFTASATIGNSMLSDDGTTLTSAGATRSNLYLKAVDNTYYGQLAFTNGTNGSFGGISYNNSGQYMQFETNSSEWMRLTNAGRLGIGTTSPSDKLNVVVSANGNNTRFDGPTSGLIVQTNASSVDVISYGGTTPAYRALNFSASASTNMTITTSGNVGIGTISPSCTLEVARNNGGSTGGQIALRNSSSTTLNSTTEISFLNDTGASGSGTRNGRIVSQLENTGNGASNMQFWTWSGSTDAERMRITSGGELLIGTTTARGGNTKLTVYGTIRSGNNTDAIFSGAGAGTFEIDYPGVVAGRFNLDNSGNLTIRGSLTQNASDQRLKKNIKLIPNAIDKICQISGVTFNWDTEKYDTGRISDIGVIAQEIEKVLPDAVALAPFDRDNVNGGSLSGENYLTVYYEKIIPLLIEGIKELKAEIDALKAK